MFLRCTNLIKVSQNLPNGSWEDVYKIIFPWKSMGPWIWTNLNFLHLRLLCAKFGWNWPSGCGEENLKIWAMYFRYFVIISPEKGSGPSYEKKTLNLTHPRMPCAKIDWNLPSGSGQDKIVKSLQTDGHTNGWLTTDDQKSSLQLSAQAF